MTTDASWLPATAAACSATILAIGGGLLATRRVTAESDARTAEEARAQVQSQLNAAEKAGRDLTENRVRAAAQQWIADHVDLLVEHADVIDNADGLLAVGADDPPAEYALNELDPHVATARTAAVRARQQLLALAADDVLPRSWKRARILAHATKPGTLEDLVYAVTYENVAYAAYEVARNAMGKQTDALEKLDRGRARELIGRPEQFDAGLASVQPQTSVLRATLAASPASRAAPAPGRWWLLGAFLLFAAGGIVLPLAMLQTPDDFPGWVRWFVVGLVGLGTAAHPCRPDGRLASQRSWRPRPANWAQEVGEWLMRKRARNRQTR